MSLLRRYTAPMPVHADDMNFIGGELEARRNITGVDCVVDSTGTHFRRRPARGTASFCLVVQNGTDPNGDPMYDVFDLDDTGHVTKLNEDPVVPENYRSPDLTYTAGTSGVYQIDAEGNFFLGVWDEERTCT